MTDWIAAARLENQKKADRPTAKTAKTPLPEGKSEVSAVLAVPLPPISRKSSSRVELWGLIHSYAAAKGFTEDELADTLSVEMPKGAKALLYFRSEVARLGIPARADSRGMCADCRRLVRGRCEAARMGLMHDTQPEYWPVPDVPRNCDFFVLKAE